MKFNKDELGVIIRAHVAEKMNVTEDAIGGITVLLTDGNWVHHKIHCVEVEVKTERAVPKQGPYRDAAKPSEDKR